MLRRFLSLHSSGFLATILFLLPACTPVAIQQRVESVVTDTPALSPTFRLAPPLTSGPVIGPESEPTDSQLEPANTTAPTAISIQVNMASDCDDPFGDTGHRFTISYWENTNFCKHSVDYVDILSGGPPPDGIPAIDEPNFESIVEADTWMGGSWPVMFFEWNGDTRAYPLAVMMWHEIVNDEVGGRPVTLTFCPLCNATIAFARELPDGQVLDFGTSGNLRNSDLIMYDRQTFSWWQQFTGDAIVGELTGTMLEFLPSQIISWDDFKANYPEGSVLSRNTGYSRNYGRNPYVGYDNINTNPFLFDGVLDGRLPATARVVAFEFNGVDVAYPFDELSKVLVVNDELGKQPIAVFWKAGTNSALDAVNFDESRDIGSTAVFLREVDGQVLTFSVLEDGFMDEETGSYWNIFGESVGGSLAGTKLEQVVSGEHFWFAWAAFKPDTIIWTASR